MGEMEKVAADVAAEIVAELAGIEVGEASSRKAALATGAKENRQGAWKFFHEPEFWVAVAFFLLIALFIYLKVPAKVIKSPRRAGGGDSQNFRRCQKLREEARRCSGSIGAASARSRGEEAEAVIAAGTQGSGSLCGGSTKQAQGNARAAIGVGAAEDRPGGGCGGQGSARCRGGDGGAVATRVLRTNSRAEAGAKPHRPQHRRSQGQAGLTRSPQWRSMVMPAKAVIAAITCERSKLDPASAGVTS